MFKELKDGIEGIREQANYQYVMMRFLLGKESADIDRIAGELKRWNEDKQQDLGYFKRVPVYGTDIVRDFTERDGDTFTLKDFGTLNFRERHQLISLCEKKIRSRKSAHSEGTIPYDGLEFSPLTDEQEIKDAHDKVVSKLLAASGKHQVFKINPPTGYFEGEIYWLDKVGIFFHTDTSQKMGGSSGKSYWDIFGTAEPRWGNETLTEWDVEINPPLPKTGRYWRTAGQFLKDNNGRIYYTHNGKPRITQAKKPYRFEDMYAGLALPVDVGKHRQLILSDIESEGFVDDVADYVKEVGACRKFAGIPGSATLVGSTPVFSFTEKDFASTTRQEKDADYRQDRFKELSVALDYGLGPIFGSHDIKRVKLKKATSVIEWGVINANTGEDLFRGYVSHPYNQGLHDWREYTWLGIYLGSDKFDTAQFQVTLRPKQKRSIQTELSASVWLDGKAKNTKKNFAELSEKQKGECLAILKNLPPDHTVWLRGPKDFKKEWQVSKLKESDMHTIMDTMSIDSTKTELGVGRNFTSTEAVKMGTKILGAISESFESLQPLRTFLNQGNNLTVGSGTKHDMTIGKLPKKLQDELEKSIKNKGQIIFYGPPGTGKTWTARAFANTFADKVESVTFHPSYTYEDFVEGIRPKLPKEPSGENHGAEPVAPGAVAEHAQNQTNVSFPYFVEGHPQTGAGHRESGERYEWHKGIFRKIVKEALDDTDDRVFVLLIDEINRGQIPKIFGELITLLEKDYRDEEHAVKLAYTQDEFHVPPNLFIVGTMNTADMSLVQVDTALRRRFAWREMMPDHTHKDIEKKYGKILKQININILGIRSDLRDKQIGHTYFMKIKKNDQLQQAFKDEIIPLLQDYFYHDYDELAKVLNARAIPKREQIIHADELKVNAELLEERNATLFYNSLKKLLP